MPFNPGAPLDPGQVDDRRGGGGGRLAGPVIAGGGGVSILFLIVSMLLGVNPLSGDIPSGEPGMSGGTGTQETIQECRTGADANQRADCRIVGLVNSIQDYWSQEFDRRGWDYAQSRTVLFSGSVQAGCGFATEAQGPFYCPADQRIYLDLSFFPELQQRFGASGGLFAEGYVVAHEYGHHVQNLVGALNAGGRSAAASVATELQADCLAGVWAHHAAATGYLTPPTDAEIASALDAAGAVGDDRIQRRTQGRVTPETWTHGSSQQRQQALAAGYKTGNPDACDR